MILIAVLLVPALSALLLVTLPAQVDRAARWIGVVATGATFVISLALLSGRKAGASGDWQHVDVSWVAAIDLRFHLGVDGISLPLVLLTTLLTLLCAVYTMHSLPAPGRPATLLALVLVLEVGMVGTFLARDLLLFFVFFEIVLAPMYFLIAVWGGPEARHAATKFVLYTLLGSVLLLVGLLTVYAGAGTLDMVRLAHQHGAGISRSAQAAAFLLLFAGLAVKSPLWPVHTWLPDAHTEAPTVGSVLLAGVLLKMGTYGLIRVALPIVPAGAERFAPLLGILAVAGIAVGTLACFTQTDLKRLVAYSSVGHMGFVLLGISTLSEIGLQAALFGNIAHGVITSLLFFEAGGIKDRFHTSEMAAIGGGLGKRLPRLGALLTLAAIASLGLPGLAGFWGEAFAVLAAYRPAPSLDRGLYLTLAVLAAVGAALAAAYFLRMLRLVVAGPPPPDAPVAPDVTPVEWLAWAPLAVLAVVLGLYPALVLDLTKPAVALLVSALPG